MREPINLDQVDWLERGNGRNIEARGKRLGLAAGARELGCSLYQLAPGKRSFPAHCHYAIEEAVLVLKGCADLRYGDRLIPLREGDFFALPAGTGLAHQMQNNGDTPVEYLCISTMQDPDVVLYPDSGKTAVMAGFTGSEPPPIEPLREIYRREPVDYFEGEDSD